MNLKRYPNPVNFHWIFMSKLSGDWVQKYTFTHIIPVIEANVHLDFKLVIKIIYF